MHAHQTLVFEGEGSQSIQLDMWQRPDGAFHTQRVANGFPGARIRVPTRGQAEGWLARRANDCMAHGYRQVAQDVAHD